jgi:NDP-sugar pyrophosphorylase family protein
MNWIIPMAGKGTRTSELGMFKPFIRVNGYTILEWLLLSLSVHVDESSRFVFVTTKAFENEFQVRENIKSSMLRCGLYVPLEVVHAEDTPQGPAKSVFLALASLKGCTGPVTVVNVDQYIHFEVPAEFDKIKMGYLPVYAEFSNKASYVAVYNGLVTRVVEKQNISNIASAGVYGISSVEMLEHMLTALFDKGETVKNEYYVGPAYNILIEEGIPVKPTAVHAKFDLGNLAGIAQFKRRLLHNSNMVGNSPFSVF